MPSPRTSAARGLRPSANRRSADTDPNSPRGDFARAGLTLAELLVVLMILAVVTSIALKSMTPTIEQSRHDATLRTLREVRQAIVSTSESSGGTRSVSGFIADAGRLPASLSELLVQPEDLPAFGLALAPSPHADVSVPRGWRGPYLQSAPGVADLMIRDGWNNPLAPLGPDPLVQPNGQVLFGSPAAARLSSTPGYQHDLFEAIHPVDYTAALLNGTLYRLENSQREAPSSTTGWSVKLLAPCSTTVSAAGVEAISATINASTGGVGFVTYQLEAPLVGPRVLRAEQNGVAKGAPIYLMVLPGATQIVDIQVE